MNQTLWKKLLLLLGFLFILCGLFLMLLQNHRVLARNPFDATFTLNNPLYSIVDEKTNNYLIDGSQRRIVKMNPDGEVQFTIEGGKSTPDGFFYAAEIAVDDEGYLFIINHVRDKAGFFTEREEILRYTPEGRFDKVVYQKKYSQTKSSLVQRGQIQSLKADHNFIYWLDIDDHTVTLNKLSQDNEVLSKKSVLELTNARIMIASMDMIGDEEFVYSTKEGKIYRYRKGEKPTSVYSGDDFRTSDTISVPLNVRLGWDGNIFFTDIGKNEIVRLSKDGEKTTFLSKDTIKAAGYTPEDLTYYSLNLAPNRIVSSCNSYYTVAIDRSAKILYYRNTAIYSKNKQLDFILIWLGLLVFIGMVVIGARFVYNQILKKRVSLIIKQLIIFIPIFILSIVFVSNMIINDFSHRYQSEILKRLAQMVQITPKGIDTDRIAQIKNQSDFFNDDYRAVRSQMHQSLNNNTDEWNNNLYFALYHVFNDKLYGLMYLNDGIGIYTPFPYFDDEESVYRKAYQGEIATEIDSDLWGTWLYAVGPIHNSKGEIIAVIEIGTDLFSFQMENSRLISELLRGVAIIALIFIAIMVLVTYILLKSIRVLRNGVNELSQGKWDTRVITRNSNDEVSDLTMGFNKMSEYIRNYINEIVALNKGYFRFVPQQFLHYLEKESVVDVQLGDQVQKEMSVMFTDIRSFTTLSEKMTPKENFDFLNSYLGLVGPMVRKNKGFIDKYIGDAIMALFPHSPDDAVQTAIDILELLYTYNQEREKNGLEAIHIGLGIHTGLLMLGILGEMERMDGTVISDNVNLASRLEGLTKHYGASIIISENVLAGLSNPNKYLTRFLGLVKVKGKKEPIGIYEVLDGLMDETKILKVKTKDLFEEGIQLFKEKRLKEAFDKFNQTMQINKSDVAAYLYLLNCKKFYQADFNKIEWDGTIKMTEK